MQSGSKVALVACSNGLQQAEPIEQLEKMLLNMGLQVKKSPYLLAQESVFSAPAAERAAVLMQYFQDPQVDAIFDISGGDIANEILPYLDFEIIASRKAQLWGYSDLTTVINAMYARAGKTSMLYSIRQCLQNETRRMEFQESFQGSKALWKPQYTWLQGQRMHGTVVGGNIRCLLKLAGTPFWPNMHGKILLLEANGGEVAQIATYLSQLAQIGVFQQVSGIILGTFSKMESQKLFPAVPELLLRLVGTELPIACTRQIGHGSDSKAIEIGGWMQL